MAAIMQCSVCNRAIDNHAPDCTKAAFERAVASGAYRGSWDSWMKLTQDTRERLEPGALRKPTPPVAGYVDLPRTERTYTLAELTRAMGPAYVQAGKETNPERVLRIFTDILLDELKKPSR
jgi:predicted phage gp36 major capsid-like protein